MGRVAAVAPALVDGAQVGDELVVHLALGLDCLLQDHDLVDQRLVDLRHLEVVLLQGLDLLLRGRERVAEDVKLLVDGERLVGLGRFPGRGCLASDVVQVVLLVLVELGVLELPCLRRRQDTTSTPKGEKKGGEASLAGRIHWDRTANCPAPHSV